MRRWASRSRLHSSNSFASLSGHSTNTRLIRLSARRKYRYQIGIQTYPPTSATLDVHCEHRANRVRNTQLDVAQGELQRRRVHCQAAGAVMNLRDAGHRLVREEQRALDAILE